MTLDEAKQHLAFRKKEADEAQVAFMNFCTNLGLAPAVSTALYQSGFDFAEASCDRLLAAECCNMLSMAASEGFPAYQEYLENNIRSDSKQRDAV